MSIERREDLASYLDKRGSFRGILSRVGFAAEGKASGSRLAICIQRPIDAQTGYMVADHVWIELSAEQEAIRFRVGARVTFTARARKYRKKRGGSAYGLFEMDDYREG